MRNCTKAQNGYNRRPSPGGNECPGVRFCEATGLWCAYACKDGKKNNAGWFADKDEAIRARDCKAVELFGEFAWLKRPQEARAEASPCGGGMAGGEKGVKSEKGVKGRDSSFAMKILSLLTAMAHGAGHRPSYACRYCPCFGLCSRLSALEDLVAVEGWAVPEMTMTTPRPAPDGHGPRILIVLPGTPNGARGPPDGPAKEHGAQMRPPPSETGGLRSLTRVHRMRIASDRCLGATERMPQPS
jgi:hypothetical protein